MRRNQVTRTRGPHATYPDSTKQERADSPHPVFAWSTFFVCCSGGGHPMSSMRNPRLDGTLLVLGPLDVTREIPVHVGFTSRKTHKSFKAARTETYSKTNAKKLPLTPSSKHSKQPVPHSDGGAESNHGAYVTAGTRDFRLISRPLLSSTRRRHYDEVTCSSGASLSLARERWWHCGDRANRSFP